MTGVFKRLAVGVAAVGFISAVALAQDKLAKYFDYKKAAERTAGMASDAHIQNLCSKHGLEVTNTTWEDTGRFKNSSAGPNISDMTLQVRLTDPRDMKCRLYTMPAIRYPNFSDKTCDIPIDKIFLPVGNEKGAKIRNISLKSFLENIRKYLSKPGSWKGDETSLLAERDAHVLVSAQACFLPVPKGGRAWFNPVIFNYQSFENNPAVLTILVTREGSSVTVIDNVRDPFQSGRTRGQRLFFNENGERASLTAIRVGDYIEEGDSTPKSGPTPITACHGGLNAVMLIQVPLKQRKIRPPAQPGTGEEGLPEKTAKKAEETKSKPDIEEAVITHGCIEGKFTEIGGLEIRRDPDYPLRVTVQFYKATSNGQATSEDIECIKKQIDKVYSEADYIGSLVLEGTTGRPTEHQGPRKGEPEWWEEFWKKYEADTKKDAKETIRLLRDIYGQNWYPRNKFELYELIARLEKQTEENEEK